MGCLDATAIATWVLAGIAFFSLLSAFIIKWVRRPILKVEIDPDSRADFFPSRFHYEYKVWHGGGQERIHKKDVNAYYVRFRVINIGRSAAKGVMAFLEKVERVDSGENVETYIPLPLKWANTDRMPLEYQMFFPRVNSLVDTWCDLGYVADPIYLKETAPAEATDGSILILDTVVTPLAMTHLIPPGAYRMTVKVAAENALPSRVVFNVTVPEKWEDNADFMFGPEGIAVRIVDGDWEYKEGLHRWWRIKHERLSSKRSRDGRLD